MRTYYAKNIESVIDTYNNGHTSIKTPAPNPSFRPQHKIIVQVLEAIAPQGHIAIIHCHPVEYSTENMRSRLPTNELFFITKHDEKINFFVYKFAGSKDYTKEIYPSNIKELNQEIFFNKLLIQPELKKLHDSFSDKLELLKLNTRLNDELEVKTTPSVSHKI